MFGNRDKQVWVFCCSQTCKPALPVNSLSRQMGCTMVCRHALALFAIRRCSFDKEWLRDRGRSGPRRRT